MPKRDAEESVILSNAYSSKNESFEPVCDQTHLTYSFACSDAPPTLLRIDLYNYRHFFEGRAMHLLLKRLQPKRNAMSIPTQDATQGLGFLLASMTLGCTAWGCWKPDCCPGRSIATTLQHSAYARTRVLNNERLLNMENRIWRPA